MSRALVCVLALSSVAPAQSSVPTTDIPRREARRLGLTLEGGFKNIAGYGGVSLTYHALPGFSVAVGLGACAVGAAIGLRGRWNLLRSALTPFLGGGFLLVGGGTAGGKYSDITRHPLEQEYGSYWLEPVLSLQAIAGVEWIAPVGFTVRLEGGYSLATGPHFAADGQLPPEVQDRLRWQNGSSPIGGVALGWTF